MLIPPDPSTTHESPTVTHTTKAEALSWLALKTGRKVIIPARALEAEADGSSSSGEEEETVDALLFAAQLDLISHNTSKALLKLERAAPSSSAACATLSSMFSKGLRQQGRASTSPTSPPLLPLPPNHRNRRNSITSPGNPIEIEKDALLAAEWSIKGLVLEVAKVAKPIAHKARFAGKYQGKSTQMDDDDESDSGSDFDSEEDGHEGKHFALERALDLVVALTDAYRFGILRPDPHQGSMEPDLAAQLWAQGAKIAQDTLGHPAVVVKSVQPNPPVTTSSDLDAYSSAPTPTTLPTAPISVLATRSLLVAPSARTASPRRTPTARSYAHPSSSMPVLLSSQTRSPDLKLQLTIRVHLLYLLALQIWPSDHQQAADYWNEIYTLTGGSIGTKEGDDIIKKALRRIEQISGRKEQAEDWKLSKRKKGDHEGERSRRSSSVNLSTIAISPEKNEVDGDDSYFPFGSLRRESGDALSGIWRLKNGKGASGYQGQSGGWGVDRDEGEENDENDRLSTIADSPLQVPDYPLRGDRLGGSNLTGSRPPSLLIGPSALFTTEPESLTGPEGSHGRDSSEATIKAAKFHFAEDYPSPPASPTILENRNRRAASHSPTPSPTKRSSGSRSRLAERREPSIILRRRPSTASFQPPSLLPRVRSSASISTLPPDFFSRSRKVNGANWNESSRATVRSSSGSAAVFTASRLNPNATPAPALTSTLSWKDSIRQRATSVHASSLRAATSFRSRFLATEAPKPSVVNVLSDLLRRDDASAGPGMYWADSAEAADQEVVEVIDATTEMEGASQANGVETLTPESIARRHQAHIRPPALRSTRSFVDPTRSSPRVTHTPPTPDMISPNRPPGTPSISPESAKFPQQLSIDPLLLALEKASRVGVKTVCATCAAKGLNYPACPRCEKTYCSRACRISQLGGGDGLRHSCVGDRKGKGRAVEQ